MDHLNVEIVGSTVTNVRKAVKWLRYNHLHLRMCKNPMACGIGATEI